jgi:hypothetical protein
MTSPGESGVTARLEAERTRMLSALITASGGDSLCTIDRVRLPAAKYYEGATAALSEAILAARAGKPLPDAATWSEWADALAARHDGWRAYIAGGRDALASALD